jgi:ubiquinone/menaquinone biosynthesis C-methylase UbiE/Tfp pilus assembly protein PilF
LNDARSIYEDLLQHDPNNADILHLLGALLVQSNNLSEGGVYLERAYSLAPGNAELCSNLGILRLLEGRLEEAQKYLRQAIELEPNLLKASIGLANVELARGQLNDSALLLSRVIRQAPNYGEAHYHLALTLERMGNKVEAVRHFHRSVSLDPANLKFRKGLVSSLKGFVPQVFEPGLDKVLIESFSFSGIDKQDLAAVTGHHLVLKHAGFSTDDKIRQNLLIDPLLIQLLTWTVNRNPILEPALVKARRGLLLHSDRLSLQVGERHDLMVALATQCINNSYVFAVSSDEATAIASIAHFLGQRLRDSARIGRTLEERILLFAMYRPLCSLRAANALAEWPLNTWPKSLQAIIQRTLLDPIEEAKIKDDLRMLAPIKDPISRAVSRQYEESPYPRWFQIREASPFDLEQRLRADYPNRLIPKFPNDPLEVLVPGCGTGRQPINLATAYRNSRIIAVDISQRSLSYAIRMAKRLKVENVEFLAGDILDLPLMGRKFWVVECCGVLHHMRDPKQGLHALTEVMHPGGVIKLALYSRVARQSIIKHRDGIQAGKISPTADEIRAYRNKVMSSYDVGDRGLCHNWPDFYDLDGCRDMLFHEQEHVFDLPELERLLGDLRLELLGFVHPDLSIRDCYQKLFPEDPNQTSFSNWAKFEEMHPATFVGMYEIWCQLSPP